MPSSDWAKIVILLNLGRVEEASVAATTIMAALTWSPDDLYRCGGAELYGVADIPVGWCFMHRGRGQVLMNAAVLDEFCMEVCVYDFCDAITVMNGPGWRRYDVESWKTLSAYPPGEVSSL
jgi:hypothetical protein